MQPTDSRVALVALRPFRPDKFLIRQRSAWPLTRRASDDARRPLPAKERGEVKRCLASNFVSTIQTATRLRSRVAARGGLLVDLPFLRGDGAPKRRALVVQNAPFGRSIAGFVAKGPFFRRLGCLAARRFPAAACPRPATSVAEPRIGPGRQPLSLRVCACEAQPRTPHPTGLGYPAPAKLSLCPTSVTPLEAPLMDRTRNIYSCVGTTSIGIFRFSKIFSPSERALPGRFMRRSNSGAHPPPP
jgi:hypothetical protein